MKPRAANATRTIIAVTFGVGILGSLAAGAYFFLQPRFGGDANAALGIPNRGNVRVVTTAIESGADKLHYKWSLIGSMNWRKANSNGGAFVLTDTYPLNSATQRGGCNVYEADLIADKTQGKWTAVLHGSDGTTVRSEGTLPTDKAVTDTVRIRQTAASVAIGTPTTLTFAEIDGKPFQLSVAR